MNLTISKITRPGQLLQKVANMASSQCYSRSSQIRCLSVLKNCSSNPFSLSTRTFALCGRQTRPVVLSLPKVQSRWQSSSSTDKEHSSSGESREDEVNPDGLCTEEHDRTIYQGILATQIKLVKSFSLLTSVIGLSCQPVILMQMQQNNANLAFMAGTGVFLSFFTFATPLLIHYISKKYVTELAYNKLEDTYTAVTYSLFLRKREIKFRLSEVQVPDIPGMFTTFKVNNTPLFVDGSQFHEPQHFGKIMGYDKPLDLRWDHEQDATSSHTKKRQ